MLHISCSSMHGKVKLKRIAARIDERFHAVANVSHTRAHTVCTRVFENAFSIAVMNFYPKERREHYEGFGISIIVRSREELKIETNLLCDLLALKWKRKGVYGALQHLQSDV